MVTVRRSNQRGRTKLDWLDSRHTFSFGDYQDPDRMGFRALRVINDDTVAPGQGFGLHAHRNMEILSYVMSGALEHRDSLGNGSVLRAGEWQAMTAGTGIRHSEFNPSSTQPVHFYQVWILPERAGLAPRYEQREFAELHRRGRWQLIASASPGPDALTIHQDASVRLARLAPSDRISIELAASRHAWLQVLRGSVRLGELTLQEGDGAAISDERTLAVVAVGESEVLLFDLA